MDFSKIEGLDEDQQKAVDLLVSVKPFTDFVASSLENRESALRESLEGEYKPKIKELRGTNIEALKSLEAFKGFDAEEYARLKKVGTDSEKFSQHMKDQETE